MPASWKTVRVFISSTFRDMQAERDHLVRFVFPRLREELLARRIHLVDVDLRWGVTSDQDASEVCREVVDECHPRFLCMLGERFGCVPKGNSRSITADEIHYGVLDREVTKRGFAFFYFRDTRATAAMVENKPGEFRELHGSDGQIALDKLKQVIADADLNTFTYPAQWDNNSRRLIGLQKFGDRVHADLLHSMKADPELQDRFTESAGRPDEFAEENAAMEAFIEERTERFVLGSRKAVMDGLLAHANGTGGTGYLSLVGDPGSGKSALLAYFSQHSTLDNQPSTLLISHFVGASTGSTDVRRALRRLCHELIAGTGIIAEIPDDPEKLRAAFPETLKQASAKKRIVILLDAVNQFDPTRQFAWLWWLPEELPDNVRFILSLASDAPNIETRPTASLPPCREGRSEDERSIKPNSTEEEGSEDSAAAALADLWRHRHRSREMTLPALTRVDGEAIITEFLHRYRKTMTEEQRTALLAKADAGTPLYLLAALEELRTLGTYEELTDRIAQLPPKSQALFTWILQRLEDDDGFRDPAGEQIGKKLVSQFASLMGVSRYGLSQRELAELLAPGDPKTEPPIPDDAQGNVAALVQLLRPYLMHRGELLDVYHGQFRAAAEKAYLQTDAQCQDAHQQLANYFKTQPLILGEGLNPILNQRRALELPWHLMRAKAWDDLVTLLGEPPFLNAVAQLKQFDLRSYWITIQLDSSYRLVDACRHFLEVPERYDLQTFWMLARVLQDLGHIDESRSLLDASEKHSGVSGEGAKFACNLIMKSGLLQARGDLDGALAIAQRATKILTLLGEQVSAVHHTNPYENLIAAAIESQAGVLAQLGQSRLSIELYQRSERAWRISHSLKMLAKNLLCQVQLVGLVGREGEGPSAYAMLTEAADLSLRLNDPELLAFMALCKSFFSTSAGDITLALQEIQSGIQASAAAGDLRGMSVMLANKARLLSKNKDIRGATEAFGESVRFARTVKDPYLEAKMVGQQARLLLQEGFDLVEGLRLAKLACRLAAENHLDNLLQELEGGLAEARQACAASATRKNQPTASNVNSDPLDHLPIEECDVPQCVNAGRFTQQRIIFIGVGMTKLVGWCDCCKRRVCVRCAVRQEVRPEDFWALAEDDSIKHVCLREGRFPATLKCATCGGFLGIGDETLTLLVQDASSKP